MVDPCELHPLQSQAPTLHLICGKIAAGKSTLAAKLAMKANMVKISEDDWLSCLYPGEIHGVADYIRCAGRLRSAMGAHVAAILRAGNSVVLDFPANTPTTRQWMRDIFIGAASAHCLHFLVASDEQCKQRLRRRNEDGEHRFNTSEAEFDEITKYFVPPAPEEGFNVIEICG